MAPSTPKKRFLGMTLIGILIVALAGCAPSLKELEQAKHLYQDHQYTQLAALEISCQAADEGCNQVHLLKGDACFRIAKNAREMQARGSALNCAAAELNTGIEMTKAWDKVPINRAQVYENACESARLRADFDDRSRYEAMLATCADRFLTFASGNPRANYYDARAAFYKLTQSANPCNGLQSLHARVASALQHLRTDSRLGAPYQALKVAISAEQGRRCGN